MTIRRDLDQLERRGLLRRVHGGAVSSWGRSYEPPLLSRSAQNTESKKQIGRAAADLIQNGDSIAMPTSDIQVRLRPARADDKEFLWQLHRATMRAYVDQTWGWDEDWQRKRFEENFNPGALEIVEINQQPAGYISVLRHPEEIFLSSIEIAPEFQNRGIGTRLIRDLLEECDRKQVPMRLFVLKVNPGRRLYEHLGFEPVEETATHHVMVRRPVSPK